MPQSLMPGVLAAGGAAYQGCLCPGAGALLVLRTLSHGSPTGGSEWSVFAHPQQGAGTLPESVMCVSADSRTMRRGE